MRVLFATTRHFLPQCVGGSEWSTHGLCAGLSRLGDTVAIHCQLKNDGWLAKKNRLKRKLLKQAFPADLSLGYRAFRGWDPKSGISEVIERFRAEIVVVVGAAPDPAGLAAIATRSGIPVVYQIRDMEFDKHGAALADLQDVHFVSNSSFTAQRFLDQFGKGSDVILPPVDPDACKVARPGAKVLLINPDPKKGGEIAIQMAEARPHIPFVFQESWPSNAMLTDLKARAQRAGNVEWRHPVLDVREAYREARILLAPSQWAEAWGRVATEAHFSGIPVIGSDCGGLSEAIGPGGLVVAQDAPLGEWLAALDTLWTDAAAWERYSHEALAYADRQAVQLDYQIRKFRGILLDTLEERKKG